ncbi:conserved hypothetical protein [Ferroglobus placidus DSM 10642]|uniref:VapB-type antitoxin n=1 Tax=Ferroglobus placidus (strain DSM 10642 / AEDII12DO) TaxID=589924 RepID=D3RZY3_FERPA|nr:hypothetical protein [Ferroglobus placidus]ADC66046.1 conserved hypothetical protein [Ferroglobus placidus DSM 10642]
MPVISVRVSDELKKKMDRHRYVNWSEIIRKEIEKVIERLESRNLAEALLLNEKIRKKSATDTTEIIREWRDKRYGKGRS